MAWFLIMLCFQLTALASFFIGFVSIRNLETYDGTWWLVSEHALSRFNAPASVSTPSRAAWTWPWPMFSLGGLCRSLPISFLAVCRCVEVRPTEVRVDASTGSGIVLRLYGLVLPFHDSSCFPVCSISPSSKRSKRTIRTLDSDGGSILRRLSART